MGANLRTKYLRLPFGDQSFLINKKLFNFLGEFTEGLEKGEDHEFIWKAKQLGIKINIIDNYILTSGIKYNANPIYQTLKTLKVSRVYKNLTMPFF